MRRKIGITLVTVGLCLILFAVGLVFYNSYENKKAKEMSENLIDSLVEIVKDNQANAQTDPFDKEMKVVDIDGYGYIGYIDILERGIHLPVMADWDYSKLKVAPCRYYGSTKTDNLVICGHNYRSHFGPIGNLKPYSTVIFTDMEGTELTYTVTSVEVLSAYDTELVKDTGDDLILYTCTYSGRTRIVVRCSYIQ